jgi:integrase
MASIYKRERNKVKPWVVRWRDDTGRQHEAAFKLKADASRYKIKLEHQQSEGTFVDTRRNKDTFGEAAEKWLATHPVTAGTKHVYGSVLRSHIAPAFGDRLLRYVAQDRDAAAHLVNVTMLHLSEDRRGKALTIVTGTLDAAVTARRIPAHACSDIKLAPGAHKPGRDDFIFPTHEQLGLVAKGLEDTRPGVSLPLTIWLMRGCGLRISEALAVRRNDFRENGNVLRIHEQVTQGGNATAPLKARKTGEYRDIPVPSYVWEAVKDLPDGYLFMQPSGRFPTQRSYLKVFTTARKAAGIPAGFTPHSLRHTFVSALLARNVPITDVSKWIGHRSINITYDIYGHLLPSAWGKAREALDAEYEDWSS